MSKRIRTRRFVSTLHNCRDGSTLPQHSPNVTELTGYEDVGSGFLQEVIVNKIGLELYIFVVATQCV